MRFATVQGRAIEYRFIPGAVTRAPLVFLHEGLGSCALWRDFPDKVAAQLHAPVLVYSRFGNGQSDGLLAKRTPRFMHEEALQVLPALLDQIGIQRPLLIGHSDGASIALVHAALSRRPVTGLVLMAPHVFVEPVTLASIAAVRASYSSGPLRARLAKYHARVDDAFLGWADAWLDPEFAEWSIEDEIAQISVPMLLIQGKDDDYGSLEQLDRIEARAAGRVSRLVLDRCGHSPQRDQEAAVLAALVAFARPLAQAAGPAD